MHSLTRKPWFIALCMLGGIAAMIAIGVFAVDGLRKTFLRTIMFTTADPDVLGEFSSTSMEPKTVVLQVKGRELISTDAGQFATGRRLERSLTVIAPAAYFSKISVKEGPDRSATFRNFGLEQNVRSGATGRDRMGTSAARSVERRYDCNALSTSHRGGGRVRLGVHGGQWRTME